jgi:hypothetical protein
MDQQAHPIDGVHARAHKADMGSRIDCRRPDERASLIEVGGKPPAPL